MGPTSSLEADTARPVPNKHNDVLACAGLVGIVANCTVLAAAMPLHVTQFPPMQRTARLRVAATSLAPLRAVLRGPGRLLLLESPRGRPPSAGQAVSQRVLSQSIGRAAQHTRQGLSLAGAAVEC